jgi:hypothetical protein
VSTIDETPRPATFRCPAGAWFGTQIGGTVWMLTGAMSLAVTSPSAAAVFVGFYAAVNVVGVSLWLRRERVGQYTAVQFMLLACGIGSLAAMLTCDFAGPAVVGEAVPAKAYLILLVYPAVMVMVAVSNAALKQQLAARPG